MDVAYQVTWRGRDGVERPATLRLEPHGVRLDLPAGGGSHGARFETIVGVDLDPSGADPSAVGLLLADGYRLELVSKVNRWILADLVGALFAHRLGPEADRRRVIVRVRLKPGSADDARRLLEAGPPFDPSSTALVAHEVFVLDDEALFLFETNRDAELLGLFRPDFWHAATAWSDLIEGSIRLSEPAYSWAREAWPVEAHPGLGL